MYTHIIKIFRDPINSAVYRTVHMDYYGFYEVADLKTILYAIMISVVIHLLYVAGTLGVGYLKTKGFKPNLENEWGSVSTLQNEVAFGSVGASTFFPFTLIGVAVLCGIIMVAYRKIREQ